MHDSYVVRGGNTVYIKNGLACQNFTNGFVGAKMAFGIVTLLLFTLRCPKYDEELLHLYRTREKNTVTLTV